MARQDAVKSGFRSGWRATWAVFCEESWMSLREAHRAMKQSRADKPLSARDCFAEPVLGRRIAPTRGLAMTGRDHDPI